MKIRSRPLYNYLLQAGVLNGTPEDIACAKQAYRKVYKKQWKQQKRPRKEIRMEVTLKQFAAIKAAAHANELKHTTYARTVVLAAVAENDNIGQKDMLLEALQAVSMAVIATSKHTLPACQLAALLQQAETKLLHYLKP
jgi:predicted DsbA family dithiol-disulfide isomerase